MIRHNLTDFPKVWRSFEKTTKDGDEKRFVVQDVTDDMFDDVATLMIKHCLPEEPFSIAADVSTNHESLKKTVDFWKYTIFPQRLSLVCLEICNDGAKKIAGFSTITCMQKGQKSKGPQEPDKMLRILDEVYSRYDIFDTFQVDKYLTGCGFVVDPEYRGLNIGAELLRAREPLCREVGIEVCETIFSVPASQALAVKAGYETLLEIEYEDIERRIGVRFPEWVTGMKIMTRTFR